MFSAPAAAGIIRAAPTVPSAWVLPVNILGSLAWQQPRHRNVESLLGCSKEHPKARATPLGTRLRTYVITTNLTPYHYKMRLRDYHFFLSPHRE